MDKQARTDALDYLSEAFYGCRAVIYDGDVWLLNEDKTYMFAIGNGRIGRQIDSVPDASNITHADLEDVIDMYSRLVLQRLADLDFTPLEADDSDPWDELADV